MMNRFQLYYALPEPSPDIEIVKVHGGEDGIWYEAQRVRAFNIEDQNYAPLSGMQDWVIQEMINMEYLGMTQTDFDAEAAAEAQLYSSTMFSDEASSLRRRRKFASGAVPMNSPDESAAMQLSTIIPCVDAS